MCGKRQNGDLQISLTFDSLAENKETVEHASERASEKRRRSIGRTIRVRRRHGLKYTLTFSEEKRRRRYMGRLNI